MGLCKEPIYWVGEGWDLYRGGDVRYTAMQLRKAKEFFFISQAGVFTQLDLQNCLMSFYRAIWGGRKVFFSHWNYPAASC